MRRPRFGIRGLLLAGSAFALIVPLVAIVALRFFDDQLIQRTEAQLIAESVLIGEAWRGAWLRQQGISHASAARLASGDAVDGRYDPIEPIARLGQGVLPPTIDPVRTAVDREGSAWRAGRAVQPILEGAARVNLSSARVLDADGCVVASSGAWLGACLDDLEEVQTALLGRYTAVLRHRATQEAGMPLFESISRPGRVRVFTATPIFADGNLIGVVRMSRTAIDAGKALWFDRHRMLAALVGCGLLTGALSLFLSRTIERPLRAVTRTARSIARGEGPTPLALPRLAPEELREMERALDQMIRQLSDRAEYIAEFAANASHELKTPIASIRGAAELLAQQWPEMKDVERQRFLENIEEDARRMERLVARLLHLARIQSAPESVEEIDPRALFEQLAADAGGRVRLSLGELPVGLRIQREHLESALRNLLDNALRHGAGKPVELEAEGCHGRVHVRVRDRGPGISAGNRDRVFQRFFTTERDRGGTGLGLAIARAVAETRGGSLEFTTSPGGTCFELVL